MSVRHAFHRRLVRARILLARIPPPNHVPARPPRLVLGIAEAHDGAALRAYEVLGGDADGPAEPGGLPDDLVQGVDRFRSADARDRLPLGAAVIELHRKDEGAKF